MLVLSQISTIMASSDDLSEEQRQPILWESPQSSKMGTQQRIPTLDSWTTPDKSSPYAFKSPRTRFSFSPYDSPLTPSPMSSPLSWRSSPCGNPPSPWPNSPSFARRMSLTGLQTAQDPVIRGTQLMGDSMLMRFTRVITGQKPTTDAQRCTRIGLCVSGQTLAQLCWRLRHQLRVQPELELSDRVLLMCGTNDILQNTELSRMKQEIFDITRILLNQNCTVTVLTIPPIPKCLNIPDIERLVLYNHYLIASLGSQDVKVVDILPLFLENGVVRNGLYEEFMGTGRFRRPDLIHWNPIGIELVNNFLTQNNVL